MSDHQSFGPDQAPRRIADADRPSGLLGFFVTHRNAANLLMVLMILFGVFALARINTQFFPTIETSTAASRLSPSRVKVSSSRTRISR